MVAVVIVQIHCKAEVDEGELVSLLVVADVLNFNVAVHKPHVCQQLQLGEQV